MKLPVYLVPGTRRSYLRDAEGTYLASTAVGDGEEAVTNLEAIRDALNGAPAATEAARVLDDVSLWLTGEGRYLAQVVDAHRCPVTHPEPYTASLEALICDVEAARVAAPTAPTTEENRLADLLSQALFYVETTEQSDTIATTIREALHQHNARAELARMDAAR